jgi:disulfide bond formation protein DsbB
MDLSSFSTYVLHFFGIIIVLVGLSIKPKLKKLGIALAVAGFLIGTSPVWYSAITQPSDEEMYEAWREQQQLEQQRQQRIE